MSSDLEGERIPWWEWSTDHWRLLQRLGQVWQEAAAAQTLDEEPVVCLPKVGLRCNAERHQQHCVPASTPWQWEQGTRLQGHTFWKPRQMVDHDDWDCLRDLGHARLIEIQDEAAGAVRLLLLGQFVYRQLAAYRGTAALYDVEPPFEHFQAVGLGRRWRGI